ncbi:MAG TPA: nucleotidyltransferase family protein [Gammaproteobacteria bacterium]|nr:nucleotidyltransferase family protein [Gammaproteobacteria bacterium]
MNKDIKQDWHNVLINPNATILSAINQLNNGAWRILLVVNDDMHLLGVITDGDIRRHLLKQASLEVPVEQIMNKHPVTAFISENQNQLLAKMHSLGILHLPIMDDQNRVVSLETFDSIYAKKSRENWVVFMAGGIGKRLHPLTVDCPKPLLRLGSKPISEILLENFIQCGFKNFYFSVNYKADMIQDYFGTGVKWGVNIQYIEEGAALGTAGSLSLLPSIPGQPFFVVNADILTNINFSHVLDFHQEQKNNVQATLCVRLHQNTIPFGVINIHETDHRLLNIEEKPKTNYFVNAGIYVLEPQSLEHLSFNAYCDMPNFLTHLVKKNLYVATFPIREYWLDIGHHDNLVQAATDYLEVFS